MASPTDNKPMTAGRKGKKRVTISDLARELNLSDRSISQALSPRESNVKLRPETVKRVQDLAKKLGYQPDSRARSMRYGKFFNIGYFEAKKSARALTLPGAEAGVFDAASDSRYRVVLIRLASDLSKDPTAIPNVFKENTLDALVLSHAGNLPSNIVEQINASEYPVVYLNEKLSHNAVYSDDITGAATITKHLIETGRKKIALLINSSQSEKPHYSEQDRREGYLNAIQEAGLDPIIPELGNNQADFENNLLQWFEANHENIDAIMCTNDFNVIQTQRLLYKYRALFPDRIALTGYDDIAEFLSTLPLTTMRIPFYQMGRLAVKMALEMVNSDKKKLSAVSMEPELIVRASTTPEV
ncbi:LacI family DNA-binding transcriptional regulator [Coraliomargarita algicola]|uniref:LacI family DNA-binding transcriptional regulator n=1 Tax=Coraliomargarita algicola TaxID=3092156 RepID=A0ABZ0RKN0_9BACT|nr:LacI family DNA-binding transcriptional regulator [Coraliomargarita sp. J2-16]WPJ96087.1 LacI family DNA-binding transcriptional regulator [Coraliomargarita sp. J2-16]